MALPLKHPLSFDEQLELLRKRGMIIEDPEAALFALKTENYYRLSGYAFQFKKHKSREDYLPETSFTKVHRIYEFDSRLRSILVRYLEIIEVCARTQIAYWFSHEYGPYGHYKFWNFRTEEAFEKFIQLSEAAIQKNKKVPFIAHHLKVYSSETCHNFPLWVLVEILSFSTVSQFYAATAISVKKAIAKSMGSDPKYLENQLHCMANLRNICAHYGRPYNREIYPAISLDKRYYLAHTDRYRSDLPTTSILGYLIGIIVLLPDKREAERLIHDIETLVQAYAEFIDISLIGMHEDWAAFMRSLT